MSTFDTDNAIIGSGQAGPFLAMALAKRGQSCVLVEGRHLGGTCLNDGCTPTKTLRKSARIAYEVGRAAEFGVRVGDVEIDFAAAMQRMRSRVDAAVDGLTSWLGTEPKVRVLREWGCFDSRDGEGFRIRAGEHVVRAKRVFLNTGTRPFIPPIDGLKDVAYLDNTSLLALRARPGHLVILGGSYIGLEMAQIFRRLGSAVTVIESAPRVTAGEDPEVSACITEFLRSEGIRILCGQPAARVEREAEGVAVQVGGERVVGSHLLVATGRVPNSDRLNVQAVGLKTDERGFIPTNERLETNVEGIWALGDINRRGAFTHTSYHDHEIVLANLQGGSRSAAQRNMIYAMFTDPPLGRVGMNETQARGSGRRMLMATFDMKDVSRAKEEGETTGLVKLLVDAETGAFTGATLLGINADEIVHVIAGFMATGAHWQVLRDALPAHPTVAEFLPTILGRLKPLE
ncbi:MAG TPA: mercuric reductase [Ramlibacter sp.]|uniref:mercuric reductase n=1 Tax=Ramlibacter sp. TaxID=1917967 RepID=UPI002C52E2F8|nr:mercuric reductase [Ramlibacter sp.]HVZ46267.1 mercuric reductase [Ramlibacter sp.]